MASEIIGKVLYHRGYSLWREGKKDAAGNEKWACKHKKAKCRFRLTTLPGTSTVVQTGTAVHSCGASPRGGVVQSVQGRGQLADVHQRHPPHPRRKSHHPFLICLVSPFPRFVRCYCLL